VVEDKVLIRANSYKPTPELLPLVPWRLIINISSLTEKPVTDATVTRPVPVMEDTALTIASPLERPTQEPVLILVSEVTEQAPSPPLPGLAPFNVLPIQLLVEGAEALP
jgi:hypothetical protein